MYASIINYEVVHLFWFSSIIFSLVTSYIEKEKHDETSLLSRMYFNLKITCNNNLLLTLRSQVDLKIPVTTILSLDTSNEK